MPRTKREQAGSEIVSASFLKRSACQIVAQLPESEAEARQVLAYVEQILDLLSGRRPSQHRSGARVVAFPADGREDRRVSQGKSSQG